MNIEDTQRLVMEIAMLIVVLYCIWDRGAEAEVAKA
jgi:hypothetical protein